MKAGRTQHRHRGDEGAAQEPPRALIIAIGGITVLYTIFNFAIYRALPFEDIKTMIDSGDYYLGTAVAKNLLGSAGAIIVTAGMIISMFGSLNGCILAFPRTYYAMAAEGHFFPGFAKLHPKYKSPHQALIVQGVFSVILILFQTLDQLTSLVVFTGMLYNFLTVIAVIIFRKKFPNIERPYKMWGYPVTVIITALLFLGLVVNTFIDDPRSAIIGICVPVVGAIVYIIFDIRLKKQNKKA
jgi:APA family basic amino acid/polyamine antiporter